MTVPDLTWRPCDHPRSRQVETTTFGEAAPRREGVFTCLDCGARIDRHVDGSETVMEAE